MNKTYSLQITDDFTTTVEIIGPDNATEFVVFSHGFGVRRDARGMFTDIERELQRDYACVRFDYTHIDEAGDTHIDSCALMEKTFKTVTEHIQETYAPFSMHVITHSLGGIFAMSAMQHYDGLKVLLAPSIMPMAERLRAVFVNRKGTTIESNGEMVALRSDGSKTYVAQTFWDELSQYTPLDEYQKVNGTLEIMQADGDEAIDNHPEIVKKLPYVNFNEIKADHNFTGDARPLLLAYIRSLFLEQ